MNLLRKLRKWQTMIDQLTRPGMIAISRPMAILLPACHNHVPGTRGEVENGVPKGGHKVEATEKALGLMIEEDAIRKQIWAVGNTSRCSMNHQSYLTN